MSKVFFRSFFLPHTVQKRTIPAVFHSHIAWSLTAADDALVVKDTSPVPRQRAYLHQILDIVKFHLLFFLLLIYLS